MTTEQAIKPITSHYATDEDYKKRYDHLCKHFKDNLGYIQFPKYDLVIRKEGAGCRWFHENKYKVEVVVNADNYADNKTHQNIAGFVLFSSFEDAILHMVLVENTALRIIEEEGRKKHDNI